ncbi:hypothetical protein J7K25_03630 [bacterium]|nr:hypothetical protein [bacterium]
MGQFKVGTLIAGLVCIGIGSFFTFKPKLTYQKEGLSDFFAIIGIIFMISGVVLIFSPFIK